MALHDRVNLPWMQEDSDEVSLCVWAFVPFSRNAEGWGNYVSGAPYVQHNPSNGDDMFPIDLIILPAARKVGACVSMTAAQAVEVFGLHRPVVARVIWADGHLLNLSAEGRDSAVYCSMVGARLEG